MATIQHHCAPNDRNGNPQRCYVLLDLDDVAVAAWDEGYLGNLAVPWVSSRQDILQPHTNHYLLIMQFQVTSIEFDFEDDQENLPPNQLTKEEQSEIVSLTIGQIWEADDEDDLVDEITCATGWCIKSIDYRHVLS